MASKTYTVLFRDGGKVVVAADTLEGTSADVPLSLFVDGTMKTRVASFPQSAVLAIIESSRLREHVAAEEKSPN